MKRIVMVAALLLAMASVSFAQVNSSDTPTREDINRFFDTMQLRTQMQTMMNTMMAQMKASVRQTLRKNMPGATPDEVARAEQLMDEMLQEPIPLNEMLDAMIPVYQRHLTRSDIDAIVAFYSSPVGLKMIRDMPAMMSEGMEAVNEITQKHMDKLMARMRERMDERHKSPPQK
jgi:uncharacterized protein